MTKYSKYWLAVALCISAPAFSSPRSLPYPLEVHLKEPVFSDGTLKTEQGGVITAKGLRIQARRIAYTNQTTEQDGQTEKISTLEAEGDLLLEYEGRFFVGSRLEFDFVKRTGVLHHGRTQEGIWFLGGDVVELKEDGSFVVHNAFITTSESQDSLWKIEAKSLNLTENKQLSASNISLSLFRVPCLWLPSFKSNLGLASDPPIRYRLTWDKGLGPRATMRYRFFSTEEWSLFFRLDYRFNLGLGGALESEYASFDKRTAFVTRSYGAYDKEVYDEPGLKHYRLQGLFSHESLDKKTKTHLTYDKFSDLKMISDFPSPDFEVDTQKRSRLLVSHQESTAYATLAVEPRLNTFESINQQLPLVKMGVRPFTLGNTGIYSENFVSLGYLDYVYAHDLLHEHPELKEIHSARLQATNRIYRPFHTGPLQLTPFVGVIGIFYNNSPLQHSIGQGALTYGGTLHSPLYKSYPTCRHTLDPYLHYSGLTRPKAMPAAHFTFSLEDGLYELNSLRPGIRNHFTFSEGSLFTDLYTYGFFYDTKFHNTFPKAYLLTNWSQPSYELESHLCWNFEESVLDFWNTLAEVTLNEHAAFACEFRHRSRFDWRKADHENFLVDMARSIDELLRSPLSDGRNTLLARLQLRIAPKWSLHLGSHFGWGRASEPSYTSFQIDLLTLLAAKWQLRAGFLHTTNDDQFVLQMQLTK